MTTPTDLAEVSRLLTSASEKLVEMENLDERLTEALEAIYTAMARVKAARREAAR